MNKTCRLIKDNESSYPLFSYYKRLFLKAKKNIHPHPDICIETCKALLEGISKTIIIHSGDAEQKAKAEVENNRGGHPVRLVRTAAQIIQKSQNVLEDNFVYRCANLADSLNEIRNNSGDISHGKPVPKPHQSDASLAELSLQMTDAVAYYLLSHYFQMLEDEANRVRGLTFPPLIYENLIEFNQWLDDQVPYLEGVSYSRALFDQDYVAYELLNEHYIAELIKNSETEGKGEDE